MPQFLVTSPEGKKYRVNAPEGATQDDAIKFVQTGQAPEIQQPASQPSGFNQQPPTMAERALHKTAEVVRAISEPISNLVASIPVAAEDSMFGKQTIGSVVGKAAQAVGSIPIPKGGKSDTLGGMVSGGIEELNTKYPRVMQDVGDIATVASAVPVVRAATPLVGAGGKAVAKGIASGATGLVTPSVDDAIKPLARRAQDLGIRLRVDQVAPTRVRNTAQKLSQNIPFSKADAFETAQRLDVQKAIAKTIGQEADNLSPETILSFKRDNSKLFDTALKDKIIPVLPDEVSFLKKMKPSVKRGLSSGSASQVMENINSVINDLKSGSVSGEKLANIRSDLLEAAVTSDKGVPVFLSRIVDHIDDIAAKGLTEQELANLTLARKQWRNFKTIKPLLEGSTDGSIDPTKLLDRVRANPYIDASTLPVGQDELVDIARIGKQFLPKKGGSDTIPNVILGGGVSSIATLAAVNPALAIGKAAIDTGIIGANRLYQLGVTNQKTIARMVKESPKSAKLNPLTKLERK